ncbi:MAG: WD40 repeat domain-containing protein [Sulfurospirillum sp.]
MKKILLILTILVIQLFAREINSLYTIKTDGEILGVLVQDDKIYASTDSGTVDIFDIEKKELIRVIKFDKIKDFFGDVSDARVFSIDKEGGKLLFVSQGEGGFSRVYLYQGKKKSLIFNKRDKLSVVKAKFISKDKIILALLSSQVLLYNLKSKKFIYNKQVSGSKFSDFALNRDRSKMALVDESGSATLIDTKDGKVIKVFKGENLDNVYQVDYKNHIIAIASKDRRCGVYRDDGTLSYYKKAEFMVYSVGLSPDGKMCAYPSDFVNSITIFDTSNKENVYKLVGDKSTISNIIFTGDKTLFTTSKNKIKFWRLKK